MKGVQYKNTFAASGSQLYEAIQNKQTKQAEAIYSANTKEFDSLYGADTRKWFENWRHL